MNLMQVQANVFDSVRRERDRQDGKWGQAATLPQTHHHRLSILTEELGEVAKALLEYDLDQAEEELIHVAAVAIANVEIIRYRRANGEPNSGLS